MASWLERNNPSHKAAAGNVLQTQETTRPHSLRDSSEAPLHHERCDLVLHLPRLGVFHGGLGEHREDLRQASVAAEVQKIP